MKYIIPSSLQDIVIIPFLIFKAILKNLDMGSLLMRGK